MDKKISKIEVQKNNKDRFNLYINDVFFSGIDAATYVKFNLKKDQVVTDDFIDEVMRYDHYRMAINSAIVYLSYKKRTEKEVRDYLAKQEVMPQYIDEVIAYCQENHYLNHEDYAQSYMNTLLNTSDKGPGIFKNDLKALGVEQNIIDEYAAKFESLVTEERLQKIIDKVIKKNEKKQSARIIEQKIIQTLFQKGYNLDIAGELLKELNLHTNEDALLKVLEKEVRRLSRKHEGFELNQKVTASMMRKGYDYDAINTALKESGMTDE